ncbi:hypothetical protein BAUCODRAFT_127319 [Baudoinia panamericana UAMH 10762]|uniref:F-box domain-containing protein n=1 Tax=Baudoinia panamericana (strain UAMH 10762) TaxID=717646 RepID=M2LBY6_BAUPA|nr:uncharacterized protein BAUCODRAFT_127319 [Baudoinia panamericana UAMH 10762]EMC91417.1 hypothetical protein BAUCODRAFT_127319 [Baudoinia panamericana UAMH 10762]
MPVFKAPVTKADRKKNRGEWVVPGYMPVVSVKPNDTPSANRAKTRCRLLELPAELRNRIYEHIFSPPFIVLFRRRSLNKRLSKQQEGKVLPANVNHFEAKLEPLSSAAAPVIRFEQLMHARKDYNGANTRLLAEKNYPFAGIVLSNKQISQESLPYMYGREIFSFSSFKLARSFMQHIGSMNQLSVRRIQLRHSTMHRGQSIDSKRSVERCEHSFKSLCCELVNSFPNCEDIDIAVKDSNSPNSIVPLYDEPEEVITLKAIRSLKWFSALAPFARLKQLKTVSVSVHDMTISELNRWFFGAKREVIQYDPALKISCERQQELCCDQWVTYRAKLYRSLGDTIARLIMGDKEPWKAHAELLEEYRAFCFTSLESPAKTLADAAYIAWRARWVKKDFWS